MIKPRKTTYIFKMKPEQTKEIYDALVKYGSVKIGMVGFIERRKIPARVGWSFKKKAKKHNEAYIKVGFRPVKQLKDFVNGKK